MRALSTLSLIGLVFAADASAALHLERSVMAGGALSSQGENLRMQATLAQPGIGVLSGGGFGLGLGFWYGLHPDPTDADDGDMPDRYVFPQNYPNPFNPTTTFRFGLPASGPVRVALYDVRGRRLRVLLDGTLPAGWHELRVEAADLPSGVYWARIQAADFTQTRKLVLLK